MPHCTLRPHRPSQPAVCSAPRKIPNRGAKPGFLALFQSYSRPRSSAFVGASTRPGRKTGGSDVFYYRCGRAGKAWYSVALNRVGLQLYVALASTVLHSSRGRGCAGALLLAGICIRGSVVSCWRYGRAGEACSAALSRVGVQPCVDFAGTVLLSDQGRGCARETPTG